MRRSVAALLAFAAAPLFGGAEAQWHLATTAAAPIEWAEPSRDVAAYAGGSLDIAWRPRSGARIGFEEWEAFLSLDGGAHWPYRLTPHLDHRLARFVVELPPVASGHARLMLRYGDEHEERELELPFEFTVAPAARYVPLSGARLSRQPGEAARPGGAGVVSWVEGPRGGSPLVRVEASAASAFSSVPALAAGTGTELALIESAPQAPPPGARTSAVESPGASTRLRTRFGPVLPAPSRADRLARLGRRNE